MKDFLITHFDTIITVGTTVAGFLITYFMTKKNFKDEVTKNKLSLTAESIQYLPYEICELMDQSANNVKKTGKAKNSDETLKKYGNILSKVLSYGSKDAIKIAIKMQQLSYAAEKNTESKNYDILAAYALLITQLKYDLTSEIISPESWFQLRLKDYGMFQKEIVAIIDSLVDELELNKSFHIH